MLEDSALDELMRDANPVDRQWTRTEVEAGLARILPRLSEVCETPAPVMLLAPHHWVSRRAFAVLSAGASALAAVFVIAVVLLSSGTTAAFAGWTAAPSQPTARQLTVARAVCGNVPATALIAAEARGPYVAIAYTRDGRPWQCLTHRSTRLLNRSTQYPPGEVIKPRAASIYLPSIHHAVVGAAVAPMRALNRERAKLFRDNASIGQITGVQKADLRPRYPLGLADLRCRLSRSSSDGRDVRPAKRNACQGHSRSRLVSGLVARRRLNESNRADQDPPDDSCRHQDRSIHRRVPAPLLRTVSVPDRLRSVSGDQSNSARDSSEHHQGLQPVPRAPAGGYESAPEEAESLAAATTDDHARPSRSHRP